MSETEPLMVRASGTVQVLADDMPAAHLKARSQIAASFKMLPLAAIEIVDAEVAGVARF